MIDELEEQGGQGLDFPKYSGVVKRRHIHFDPIIHWLGGCLVRKLGAAAAL